MPRVLPRCPPRLVIVLVAALTLVALTLVACSSDRQTLTAPTFGVATSVPADSDRLTGEPAGGAIDSVAMVGDSITVGAADVLEDGFRRLGLDVRAIEAASGRRIVADGGSGSSGLNAVVALGAAPSDLWVIALGTNDVFQYDSEEDYRDQIATLLGALPSDVPVVWVDTYLADDPARSDAFNRALRDTLAFRGNATVADWASVAAGDGVLRDGVHPTPEGNALFADVVMEAVDDWIS